MARGTADHAGVTGPLHAIGTVAGAAGTGALLGAALLGIWAVAVRAAAGDCASSPTVLCGVSEDGAGYLAGLAVVIIGTLAAFALLRIRPVLPSGVGAALLAGVVLVGVDRAVPGGRPSADWVLVPLLAAAYALVAVAVLRPGPARLAAGVLLAAVAVAALGVAPRIGAAAQAGQQQARLAGLPFPLVLPSVPGYKIALAYQSGDTLQVGMTPDRARRDQFGAYEDLVLMITIGPDGGPAGSPGAGSPADCLSATPAAGRLAASPAGSGPAALTCRVLGPGLWSTAGRVGNRTVTAHRDGLTVTAETDTPEVSDRALVQAVTRLRPATAAQVQAVGAPG